jgi:SET domain-containing protein
MPTSAVLTPRARSRSLKSPWIRADQSVIHGRGVYARVPIPAETRIIEYVGERITKAEAKRREKQRLLRQKRGGDGSVYIFELNRRYDLDGRFAANVARLINHSCAPNCRAETIRGRIWIIANRDIPAGEELTFDYGYGFSEWRLHPCRCGASRCPGFIINSGQRWRVRRIVRKMAARNRAAQRLAAKAGASDQVKAAG